MTEEFIDEWLEKSEENVEKWGKQRHDTLLLALVEEVGEIAMAFENECSVEPVDSYEQVEGLDLIHETAELGDFTRAFLEDKYSPGEEYRIMDEPENAERIIEEIDDTVPLLIEMRRVLKE